MYSFKILKYLPNTERERVSERKREREREREREIVVTQTKWHLMKFYCYSSGIKKVAINSFSIKIKGHLKTRERF